MTTTTPTWAEDNQRELLAAMDAVRMRLERGVESDAPVAEVSSVAEASPAALDRICQSFALSVFERDILLLCAAMELDSSFAAVCASAHGDSSQPYPTFGLALATLREPHWSALTPAAPLRRWRLIELQTSSGVPLLSTPLRITERVLHSLAGIQYVDERLASLVERVPPVELVPSHQAIAAELASAIGHGETQPPIVHLFGSDAASRQGIAAGACASLALGLYALDSEHVPSGSEDISTFLRLWERETALTGRALYLETESLDRNDAKATGLVSRLVELVPGVVILGARDVWRPLRRPAVWLETGKPTADEQHEVWTAALGETAASLNGSLHRIVAQFNLTAPAIQASAHRALSIESDASVESRLWDASRAQARPRLDDLAERIQSMATWDDLILPDLTKDNLREIAAQVAQRGQVYHGWGFAGRSTRGLGLSAMFAGASGTGKTMAAEVLAKSLRLDLYRIDLSSVVSKYIGETEKNLRRVFDAAEDGGAILFFDEADALFGKRSEVKDSHDRFANIEISYLLQRMESYRGLAILATNLRGTVDSAFLRRIRFVVNFAFPDVAMRTEIWRRAFPAQTPTEGLNPAKLARLNVAGGNIRNIAMNAAFLAADAGESVKMAHVMRSARGEYAKLDKPLTEAETGDWG